TTCTNTPAADPPTPATASRCAGTTIELSTRASGRSACATDSPRSAAPDGGTPTPNGAHPTTTTKPSTSNTKENENPPGTPGDRSSSRGSGECVADQTLQRAD